MNKDKIKLTKILKIIIMTLVVLLILPKTENARSYTFNPYGDSFTVSGVDSDDEYALSYDLMNASSISEIPTKWTAGKEVSVGFSKNGTDGYYMMRWRKRIRNRIREQCFLWSIGD